MDAPFVDASYLGVLALLQGDPATARGIFASQARTGGLAMAEHDLGHVAASKAALAQLIATRAKDGAYAIAIVHAWPGDHDSAFSWLERAFRQHDEGLMSLTYDPLLRGLYPDPRFTAFCGKIGLPAPSANSPDAASDPAPVQPYGTAGNRARKTTKR